MKHRRIITGHPYRCNACRVVVLRDSTKRWLKSLCQRTGRDARLYRVSHCPTVPLSHCPTVS